MYSVFNPGKRFAFAPSLVLAVTTAFIPLSGMAQQLPQGTENLPVLVVSPLRSPLALSRSGSAVTVIRREQIRAWGSKSIADVLRASPGVDITETGGPGSLSYLSLRGAGAGQTLVLIDGIRVGDTSSTSGDFDFSTLSTHDIERIEVLRGPQSALYGSDAMGGVVNIITRKGARKPRTTLSLEGGSFGTFSSTLSTSGATDKLSYAFSIHGFHTDGFSRYGYRIGESHPCSPGPWSVTRPANLAPVPA